MTNDSNRRAAHSFLYLLHPVKIKEKENNKRFFLLHRLCCFEGASCFGAILWSFRRNKGEAFSVMRSRWKTVAAPSNIFTKNTRMVFDMPPIGRSGAVDALLNFAKSQRSNWKLPSFPLPRNSRKCEGQCCPRWLHPWIFSQPFLLQSKLC